MCLGSLLQYTCIPELVHENSTVLPWYLVSDENLKSYPFTIKLAHSLLLSTFSISLINFSKKSLLSVILYIHPFMKISSSFLPFFICSEHIYLLKHIALEILILYICGNNLKLATVTKVDLSKLPPRRRSLLPHISRLNHKVGS